MKRLVLAFVLVGFAADAQAISRYNSTSMSCAEVLATLRQDGAAIMRYGSKRKPGLQLYGRYVAGPRFCAFGEIAESVSIPASDTAQCPVRECRQVEFEEPFNR